MRKGSFLRPTVFLTHRMPPERNFGNVHMFQGPCRVRGYLRGGGVAKIETDALEICKHHTFRLEMIVCSISLKALGISLHVPPTGKFKAYMSSRPAVQVRSAGQTAAAGGKDGLISTKKLLGEHKKCYNSE